jgi:predicted Holliday junction resolvase-like endonuclease
MLENILVILVTIFIIIITIIYYRGKIKELTARIDSITTEKAQQLFREWKEKEFESMKNQLSGAIKKEYEASFKEWKQEYEERIRQDAIQKSMAIILGKVGEELAPLLVFSKYGIKPKDIRHIGSPIDYIAFKGLTEENPEEIYFIEVKSGNTANLTETQRKIKDIVEAKKVKWLTIHLPSEINTTQNTSETQQLSTENSRMHESIEQDTSQASTVKTVMLPTGEEVILSKDGSELGRMRIDKNAIHVTPSLKFNEEISPFKRYLIDRVLEGMKSKDIGSGKKEGVALFYEIIKDANNNVKELIIRNVDTNNESVMRGLRNSIKWTLERIKEQNKH